MIARREVMPPYLPTPNQIREECRDIRREWSTRERASRRTDGRHVWRMIVSRHPRFDHRQRFDV
jgi:hypothetical protein